MKLFILAVLSMFAISSNAAVLPLCETAKMVGVMAALARDQGMQMSVAEGAILAQPQLQETLAAYPAIKGDIHIWVIDAYRSVALTPEQNGMLTFRVCMRNTNR